MSDIESWLLGLGLEKYLPVFTEAEIDFATLPYLTEDDLKELGLPLGPRRKILGAAQGGTDAARAQSFAQPDGVEHLSSAIESPLTTTEAERRHLTVMFVDLVGSTELAGRLDPEDMRDVITTYQNGVAGVVARYAGFVAKFMGDGVLCYFGWPRANEDDAERAVRAGLAIIDTVKATTKAATGVLSTRIGIATGVVIVGDLIGQGATQEAAVVGETPNLAARLQGIAQPNQLVLPQETRNLLGNIFELETIGSYELKGIAQPVTAYAVVGETARGSRFEARKTGALSPIVGREQELSLMTERWRTAASGAGQMIVVSGEAGIGKSRITIALTDTVGREPHARLTFQCSPYHTDSAFHPIVQYMALSAGFEPEDALEARLDKLERLPGIERDNAGLLAALLGIDGADRYGPLDLSPAQQRARTMQALVEWIVRQAEDTPLLIVFEDLHWIDPTSLELLDIALDVISNKKVLILATARPTFEHGFGGHPAVSRFALNRLGTSQIASIVTKLTGGRALPEEVLQVIADRTDGVPLFVEELTKTVLESGQLREDGDSLVLDGTLEALAIPNSLHDSLMARLDRLQPIKEVAQTAACIGREFGYRLLLDASRLPAPDLEVALDGLIKAELVFRRGVPPEAIYLFKHALVRDAAYESLLKSKRQGLHARILKALEETDAEPEILALHAKGAGLTEKAIEYYQRAGSRALARPAYVEAIASLRQGIALIDTMGGERHWRERELELQVQLGQAFLGLGYGARETTAVFRRALDLVEGLGETPWRFPVFYGNWVGHYVRGEIPEAMRLAIEMTKAAERRDDDGAVVVSHRILGASQFATGRFVTAREHLEHGLRRYDPNRHGALKGQFGQEPGATLNVYLALTLWGLGYPDRARKHGDAAILAARESRHPLTLAHALGHMSVLCGLLRDHTEARKLADECIRYSEENGVSAWQAFAQGFIAAAFNEAGKHDSALETIERCLVLWQGIDTGLFLPLILGHQFEALTGLGRFDEAEAVVGACYRQIEVNAERWNESDTHRIEGNLRLARGEFERAEHCYRQALDIAGAQEAKSFELRAATALAGLWASQGERNKSQDLLAPIYNWFTEGFDTADLKEAKALLDELG